MTIGFIGAGNMAEALIRGILKARIADSDNILISDIRPQQCKDLSEQYGVKTMPDTISLVGRTDILILSIKPQQMNTVLTEIARHLPSSTLVISIAAGITTSHIAKYLRSNPIIRVMPNTPALVGQGASALFSSNASREEIARALGLFMAVGKAVIVEQEVLIDVVTAVSGSGPAYYFLLMEHMIAGAQKLGLDADIAIQLVLQTAKGAALLAESAIETGQTPQTLRHNVTSPGGTTAAALKIFEEHRLDQIVAQALAAAYNRSIELSG
ncbi:MAG: pyrroline-5-carboxylate reductase [Sedimentisphaerales bacterium]|nr:pyrroline-5-carboxylate reductase [Sedimentisphaerales bacterium]